VPAADLLTDATGVRSRNAHIAGFQAELAEPGLNGINEGVLSRRDSPVAIFPRYMGVKMESVAANRLFFTLFVKKIGFARPPHFEPPLLML
jgi:hypothetical protein